MIVQTNLEFKGPGNGTDECWIQKLEGFLVALGILREVMYWE